jgi:probable rRNA maturation factor
MFTFDTQPRVAAPFALKALAKKAALALGTHINAPVTLEATLVLAGNAESRALNRDYRGKDKPTNVLSFPQLNKKEIALLLRAKKASFKKGDAIYLGDILLCLPVLKKEAVEQKKPLKNHVIHLIVHGALHLLGYDHMNNREAGSMEKLETAILASLNIPDPYDAPAGKASHGKDREPVPNRKKKKKTGSRTKA